MEKLDLNPNIRAFLDMLAVSELGQGLIDISDNGYDVIVGSTAAKPILFNDYSDHPRKLIELKIKGNTVKSTAAGRYQILSRFFDAYRVQLRLPDFGPDSQDQIAIQLIKECKALDLIKKGHIEQAIAACRSRWASLPGAGYGQHENDLKKLAKVWFDKGGKIL